MTTITSLSHTAPVTDAPGHGHDAHDDQRPPVRPAQAARALKVRRETVHRWIASGRIQTVMAPNPQGRLVKLVPQAEIDRLVGEGVRGPSHHEVTQEDHAATGSPSPRPNEDLLERLELVQRTASTLQAQVDVVHAQVQAAVDQLDQAPTDGGWWRSRRARRERQAIAETALRQLAAIPPGPDLSE
jgi:hypothetical protein